MSVQSWTLCYAKKPWTINAERQAGRSGAGVGGHFGRASLVKEWREAFYWLAKETKVPPLKTMEVWVYPESKDRRRQDVAACLPAVKAAVDGIRDSGALPDDGPDYVTFLGFAAPVVTGRDAVVLILKGEPKE